MVKISQFLLTGISLAGLSLAGFSVAAAQQPAPQPPAAVPAPAASSAGGATRPPRRPPAPLPPMTWTPNKYEVLKVSKPLTIDGKLDEKEWARAQWTSDFVDIEGDLKPKPKYRTRAKMLWDDNYLYIAAELEEPNVTGTLTKRDSVIFHDNDFEIFIKPLANETGYFEFEMNALNTGWDLYLDKPYREGGHADNSWDIEGLKTAVTVQGTLNKPEDTDKGWTVEVAYPWKGFLTRQQVPQPKVGTEWRIDFSRVEWLKKPEENWVWSPQGVINMHVPDRWGYLEFQGKK